MNEFSVFGAGGKNEGHLLHSTNTLPMLSMDGPLGLGVVCRRILVQSRVPAPEEGM